MLYEVITTFFHIVLFFSIKKILSFRDVLISTTHWGHHRITSYNVCYTKLLRQLDLQNPVIWADEARIIQILRHLLVNAYRFSDQGLVFFGCYEAKDKIIFYVKDEGRGIRPEHENHIFDPFVKFQSRDNTIERGVGMGLHLVKKLVELMGGEIWYSTKYLKGSEFYFSIPRK